jgi:hypothetical protein
MTQFRCRRITQQANGAQVGRVHAAALFLLAVIVLGAAVVAGQSSAIDPSRIGPGIGTQVPEFSGTDQFGRTHTLASSLGPQGAMLVFFRSADW